MVSSADGTDLKYTQIGDTLDIMFDHMTNKVPLDNRSHVASLWFSLYSENLISKEPTAIVNSMGSLNVIKRYIQKNPKSRSVVQTWLLTVRRSYNKEFLFREKVCGLRIIFDCKSDTFEEKAVNEWFGLHSLIPLGIGKEENSLFISFQKAWNRLQDRDGNTRNILHNIETIKERIKKYISVSETKLLHEIFPQITDWKEFLSNDHHIYVGQPFFLLFASEAFDVKINVICYPSAEEVNFYPSKPTDVLLRFGLIKEHHYVCLIPKDEENKHDKRVKSLEISIKELKKRISDHESKITELEKEKHINETEINKLKQDKNSLEQDLKRKEQEKADLIAIAEARMKEYGKRIAKEVTDRVTEEVTEKLAKEFGFTFAGFLEK